MPGGDEVRIWTGSGTVDNALSSGELYVQGDLEVDGSIYGDGANITGVTAAAGWTDGGTNVYVTTTTDNVGVGTTAPASGNKLHVEGQCVTGDTLLPILRKVKGQGLRVKAYHLPTNPTKEAHMKFPYEDLTVWQKAMELVEQIYHLTKIFPKDEQYGLTSQIRRAAISISVNIAEGKGRFHRKEYKQFLYNARGSLYETTTLRQLAKQLGYLREQNYQNLRQRAEVILSQLSGLINYLKEE